MSLFTCPKCKAKFDVSQLPPGSTFVCGSCKNVLQVPRGPVAPPKVTLPGRPGLPPKRAAAPGRPGVPQAPGRARATPGRAATGPQVDPRRAGAVAPPPAKPPRGGSSVRRGRAASRGGQEKSNLPIVLGGVGALVVIIVVVAIFVLGGDDKTKKKAGGTTPVAAGGPGNPGGGDQPPVDQKKVLNNRLLSAAEGKDKSAVEAVFREAETKGYRDIMRKAAKFALEIDESIEWANFAVGNKDLREIYSKIPQDVVNNHLRIPEWDTLEFEADADERWGSKERYAELSKALSKVQDHVQKLKSDRFYKDRFIIETIVRKHPAYSQFEYKTTSKSPYVIFAEYNKDQGEKVAKRAKQIVDRNAAILQALYKTFHEVFGTQFDLPEINELERDDMRTLKIWTFFNKSSFDTYQKLIRRPLPPGAAAYYMPMDQWVTLFESPGETTKTGEAMFNINKIFHEGAHQLVHVYTKALMEREKGGEEVLWSDNKTHSRCHWFQEGLAEFFASAKKNDDDTWTCLVPYRHRILELKRTRHSKRSEWSFEEMLSIRTGPELQNRSRRKGLGDQVRLASLFYAQAWTWVHFLYFFEDGKYRDKFKAYAEKEFHGISGPDVFVKVWSGGSDKVDWTKVKKEYAGYVDKLLKMY